VIAVTDDAGNPVAINGYDAWGIPNATNGGRFQYTGQAWLPELGLYYYKARIYSPTLGRFLHPDPVGYEGGINIYAYVANDPINAEDSSGLAGVPGCGTRIEGESTSGCLTYQAVESEDGNRKHKTGGGGRRPVTSE
jgi:RHS repeat-associated protein